LICAPILTMFGTTGCWRKWRSGYTLSHAVR
jgi:hypothetical protein